MKKNKILILLGLIIVSTIFIFSHRKDNELSTKKVMEPINIVENKKENSKEEKKIDVDKEKKKIDELDVITKQNNTKTQSNNNNSQAIVTEEENNNQTNSSNNNQTTKTQNNSKKENNSFSNNQSNSSDGNLVNKNTIDYLIHKGRIDNCSTQYDCMNLAINLYLRYKMVIANYYLLDVIANNGNTLGYFIEYVFKEGEFDLESDCNTMGNNIKNELSDRVVGYKCSNRNGKYYLNITTDYD